MFAASMPYQVTRTDTGQFVFIDPASETVVIDDDLVAGFAKLDKILAERPPTPKPAIGPTAFQFRGGPRYTPILLAIVLPFVWLLALYLALGNLLAQHSLTLEQARDTKAELDDLQGELQALRSEISGAPRSAKTKAKPKPKPVETPEPAESAEDAGEPTAEVPTAPAAVKLEVGKADASKSPTGGPPAN